jgi:hypothetical protein
MVNELFATLTAMRDRGITVLMIEQNAKPRWKSPTMASCLELGRTRIADSGEIDPRRPAHRATLPRRRIAGKRSPEKGDPPGRGLSGRAIQSARGWKGGGRADRAELVPRET